MHLQLKKLHKKFGTEIINFNLSKKLNNQYFKEILKTFDQYGILLFSNQKNWVKGKTISDLNENLKKFVEKSKLNLNIDSCINNKQIEDHILMDRINGVKKFKIESTPTLIINGEKFENHTNYKKLKNYIEKLI